MPRRRLPTIAIILLLVVPPAVSAAQPPAGAAGPAPIDGAATPSQVRPAPDPSPSAILRGLYTTAGVDPGDSGPLPPVAEDEPLVRALKHLADARGQAIDEEALQDAREDADDLPPDLRAALALVVEANARATERNRRAAEAGTLDTAQSARDALLVARAVDAALPILRKYSLFHGSQAQALRLEQSRTVDAVVALASGGEPLQADDARADLPGAVLDLYDVLGVEATPTDTDRLEAGAEALPEDVRKAATVTTRAQARSARLRAEAFQGLDQGAFATLADRQAGAALAGSPSPANLDQARSWVAATEGLDRAKLAEAQLAVVTAALQANAILHGQTSEDEPAEDPSIVDTIWNGLKSLVDTLNPVATASAQTTGECPRGSPLADCDNDVWFTDPFGIVVVSGPGTTVYDARYGQVSLSDRTSRLLKRLPTDGIQVQSRNVVRGTNIVIEGSLPREIVENETQRRSIRSLDRSTLQRPYYAASLDLGGDDVYVHHTASTLNLADQAKAGPDGFGVDADEIPLFTSLLVDAGGDDRYDPGLANRSDDSIAHAGPAGLGVLLDASGDDTYRGGADSIATATTLGRSVLLDLDGADDYAAGNRSAGSARLLGSAVLLDDCAAPIGEACQGGNDTVRTGPRSQGWGALAGVGALVNRGGNDTYRLDGGEGQGEGSTFGLGAFVDLAGNDTGIHPGASGDSIDATGQAPLIDGEEAGPTAEVVARPNDEPVRGSIWVQQPTDGAGLAAEIDVPAALELGPDGLGVLASFERTSAPGVELPGLFFVDGATDTVYDQPYAITVDLAGFDTYRNNAGGAINLSDVRGPQGAAGTALALDLGGSDRYDARDAGTKAWGVQGAARNGAGLLVDLGRQPDTYVAGDRAQGYGDSDGVGLLLDDGALGGTEDTFRAFDKAQGYGHLGGLGALVTLDGHTRYQARDRSQGFGGDAGIGLLVDRRYLASSVTDRPEIPEPSGDDTYRAGTLAQGAAAGRGVGLLADVGGDDSYTVANRGQGFADPNPLSTPDVDVAKEPSEAGKRPPTAADASRGLLVDLSGRDTYEADGASPADTMAHGYADKNTSDVRSRALLADFALPRVPLISVNDLTVLEKTPLRDGSVNTVISAVTGVTSDYPETDTVFPTWDPTNFYDRWLRQGRGDDYIPRSTPFPESQPKRENSYWEQPPADDTSVSSGNGTFTAPTSERLSAGLGVDNPPIAAPKAGSDRFFAAVGMVDRFLDQSNTSAAPEPVRDRTNRSFVGTVVDRTRPDVELHVHPFEDGECTPTVLNGTQPADGIVCLEAHSEHTLEVAGDRAVTSDPDKNMEVEFEIRANATTDWKDLGGNGSRSYYGSVRATYGDEVAGERLLSPTSSTGAFTAATVGSDTVGILLDSDALCAATDGTGYCPDATRLEPRAWPDGEYKARATVRTISSTLTAGRATAHANQTFAVDNNPRLLGVDVTHPNPVTGTPGRFTLYTTEPHRGYGIEISEGPLRLLENVSAHALTSTIGEVVPFRNVSDGDATFPGRDVAVTEATWPAEGEGFPQPGTYHYDVDLNRYEGNMTKVKDVVPGTNSTTDTGAALDREVRAASAGLVGTQAIVAGGVDDQGLRDEVLTFDPSAGELSEAGHRLPEPLAHAAAAVDTERSALYLFGGVTEDGRTDAIVRAYTGGAKTVQNTDLPDPISHASAAYHPVEDRIYVFGGRGPDGLRDEILVFDPANGTIEVHNATLPEPLARSGAATHGSDGPVIVAGGVTDDGRTSALLEFRPAQEEVEGATTLAEPVTDPAVRNVAGEIYVMGGTTEAQRSNRVTLYDVEYEEGGKAKYTYPLELPRPRVDTLTTVDTDGNSVHIYGAGKFNASRSPTIDGVPVVDASGNITVDVDPPTLNLTLNTSVVGCADPTCQGNGTTRPVEVPFRAIDTGSGVAEVRVELTNRTGDTVVRTPEPDEPTPTVFAGSAQRSAGHGERLEVTATPVDGAGHEGAGESATYFVDLAPPEASTRLPWLPTEAHGTVLQNATVFPVAWRGLSTDVTGIQIWYRVHDAHADFRKGLTVDATEPGQVRFPAGELAPDLVGDGTTLDVRVRAVDDAGNRQPLEATDNRTIHLDLRAPEIRAVDVDPGFQRAVLRYELTEPSIVHRVRVVGPDGVAGRFLQNRTSDELTFVIPDLDSSTTYDVTITSFDAAGNAARRTVNFTTESSLSLDWGTPAPGGLLSGETQLRFRIGAAPEARDDTTRVTLRAQTPGGSVALVDGLIVGVDGNRSDPKTPSVTPYPISVDTTSAPEGASLTLQLVARNAHGTTTATRTVTIDNTPPTVPPNATATLEGTRGPAEAGIPWFRGPVNVTDVPATDAVSGVNRTLYGWSADAVDRRFDPADPPNRTGEGVHAFHHRSVDEAGNAENTTHVRRFGIDLTAPNLDPATGDRALDDRNVTLSLNATDDRSGVLHVRAHLADRGAGPWLPVNASTTSPTITLPDEDGRHDVTVSARDRAGNVARTNVTVVYSTRPPALVGAPTVKPLSPVAAQVSWTTDKASETNLAVPNVTAQLRVETVGFTTRHQVVVTGLEPGTDTQARITLRDTADHTRTVTVNLTTPDDDTPPTAVGNLTAVDTGAGSVAVAWEPAQDDSRVVRYHVQRATAGGPYQTVANVTRTQVVDRDVDLGTPYRYRVRAVDAAGRIGPAANATATPTMPPAIKDPVFDTGSVNGTAVLFLEVTVAERGRAVEGVQAKVDGTTVPLSRVNATDAGLVFQATVDGSNLTVADGVDIAFLAEGEETTVRHPRDGFLHVDAAEFGVDEDQGFPVPGPGAWSLVATLAAALALARRRGGGPPGGAGSRGHDPGNLI